MIENQESSSTSTIDQSAEKCPQSSPPEPENCEVPKLPSDDDIYKKLEEDKYKYKKAEIDAALKTAERVADDKYAESIQKAGDTKAEAKSKHDLACAKHKSATDVLRDKTINAKEELCTVYDKCIMDSLPKNCTDKSQIKLDKKAICIEKLTQGMLAANITFNTEQQKHDQVKSAADADWNKAQQAYEFAANAAQVAKKKAYQDAKVKWREDLSKALEEVC